MFKNMAVMMVFEVIGGYDGEGGEARGGFVLTECDVGKGGGVTGGTQCYF